MKVLLLFTIICLSCTSVLAQKELSKAIEQRELSKIKPNIDSLKLDFPKVGNIKKEEILRGNQFFKSEKFHLEFLKNNGIYVPIDSSAAALIHSTKLDRVYNAQQINRNLQEFQSYLTLKSMYLEMDRYIFAVENYLLSPKLDSTHTFYLNGLYENKKRLIKQLEFITETSFTQYRFSNTSKEAIKSINLYHENDFFNPIINKDMNYTGGLKLELTTDLLKLRLFKSLNNSNILSYQGLFFGIKALTPYIRFDSLGSPLETKYGNHYSRETNQWYDRPFASYTYFGRAKYRINYSGTIRSKGELKIGVFGGDLGSGFQTAIHRDLTINSPKPIGWERQIGSGGRFAININQEIQILLKSNGPDVFHRTKNSDKNNFNIFGTIKAQLGQEISALDLGVGFSSLHFKDRSGTELIKNSRIRNSRFIYTLDLRYQYVFHNTYLEGFGWLKTNEEDNDGSNDENISVYKFDNSMPEFKNVVNRNRLTANLFLGYRINKTMIFYSLNFGNQEFFPEKINYSAQSLKNQEGLGESFQLDPNRLFNNQKWYGYGKLGFNFIL